MPHPWIAGRMAHFESSGIRRVFDLAAEMSAPINLSIGQPDFAVPEPIKRAAIDAIEADRNGYSVTQGIPPLRERLQAQIDEQLGHADRKLFVSSGTSGGLVLALMTMIDPGDEVIIFDPYFVMYPSLVAMVGGVPHYVDTYPDFRIDLNRVARAINSRTKAILFNSPANPTGGVAGAAEVEGLARLAAERNVALVSDEIYRRFCYDEPFVSPAEFNDRTIVIDGFSKTYGVTGWRLGFVHGPGELIDEMLKLQQYTFVCAPHPLQWAALAALDVPMDDYFARYHHKRDLVYEGLREHYHLVKPGGAFYACPKLPEGCTGEEFVARAVANNLLIIPGGGVFSRQDTHFRISYAASDETLERGIEVLQRIAS